MTSSDLALGAEFPAATREQWLALVDGVLKGASFDKKLVTATYDGISVQPLYTSAEPLVSLPGEAPFQRSATAAGATAGGWDVRQLHERSDAAATNQAVLDDLGRGVTSVWLRAGAGGVPIDDLPRALDGVYLDLAPVVLSAGSDAVAAAEALERVWTQHGVPKSAVAGNLGLDPANGAGTLDAAVHIARGVSAECPGVRTMVVDGTALHAEGASDVDELAYLLAVGVEYLRHLNEAGLSVDAAAGQLEFRIAVTGEQFSSIAKLRAARRLWGEVISASGGTAPMRQHAVTSRAMMTQRDPWVNMLRTTVACFAAGVAGADSVTVLPFDDALGLPDDFARRIARNTQALLIDESNVARVIDPAGGSWYVETLTNEMAERAWSSFQEFEAAGGYFAAAGKAAERAAVTWSKRSANIARRKDPLTGVSEFPNIDETRLVREPAPARGGHRYAEQFEALRDRAEAGGPRPAMFLANLGPIAVHSARAGFAKNFFEAGGIATLSNDGFADDVSLAAAFKASDAKQAVLCSSDKVYDERATAAAQALRRAGASFVYLAGNPGDRRGDYEAAGIGDFIYVGCDAVAALTAALDREER